MNASSIAAELQQLEQYMVYDTIVRQLGVSAAVLYVWDFVLTFHDEVNILWPLLHVRERGGQHLGFCSSLIDILDSLQSLPLPSHQLTSSQLMSIQIQLLPCHAFTNFDIIGLLLVSNIEIILLRRLFALYDHSMKFITMGIAIAMSIYAQANEYVLFGICVEAIPSWFIPFWTPIMAFDFVIMVLAGFKSVQHYCRVPNKKWSGARFMKTLARDSFVYFACNFFNYLAITFVFHLAPPEFFQLGASWTIVIPPITANHLLINMEQSRFREINSTTNSSTSAESESSQEIELTQCRVRNTAPLAVA
ncbi:hypothetical protein EV702DRAFT_1044681 [Suillus placidus]|uniref:DUF6533 domain-containing protein n=1 Tax=Suillus placidus TaxID=48579 RepID=A0A9P6ZX16_9AGAM|nr:hypothetical protein EV702DRAFT_1044681 [Suillus placidus]